MTAINSNRAIRGPVTAVPVVAGKGVRLVADTENNRWVVEADETVLWDGGAAGYKPGTGSAATNVLVQLSEAITNFDRVRIYLGAKLSGVIEFRPDTATTVGAADQYKYYHTAPDDESNTTVIGLLINIVENDPTKLRFRCGYSNTWSTAYRSGEDWGYYILYKIVGCNRIASN